MIDPTPAIEALAPHIDAAAWTAALAGPFASAQISTKKRVAMFLGQCSVESRGFSTLEEDLWYLSPDRIAEVYPHEFPSANDARPYVGDPQKLANRVYANRLGNGPEDSGDGWTFRGRGLIQITGRANYTTWAAWAKRPLDEATDWAATPPGAASSAAWFWTTRGLNSLSELWEITMTTRRINPAGEALQQRIDACNLALRALMAEPVPTSEPSVQTPPAIASVDPADVLNARFDPANQGTQT